MENIVSDLQQWFSTDILIGLTALSLIGFIGSLVAIPWILIRLPSDYFDIRVSRHWMKDHHPILRIIGLVIKNTVGAVFLATGFIMLFLPGQGLLTMLIGISFIDFPNKRALEARIIGRPTLLNTINAIRRKFNRCPLILADTSRSRKDGYPGNTR